MNNILTLNDIAAKLATISGISHEEALQSIETVLNQSREQIIENKEAVVFPDLGVLAVNNNTLEFTPDESLAETVNEPFAFFEPVPYSPEAENVEEIPTAPSNTISEAIQPEGDTPTVESKPDEHEQHENPELAVSETSATTEKQVLKTDEDLKDVEASTGEIEPIDENGSVTRNSCHDTRITNTGNTDPEVIIRTGFSPVIAYILGILTGMILVCIAVYFLYPPIYGNDDDEYSYDITSNEADGENSITESIVLPTDSIEDGPTSELIITDQEQSSDASAIPTTTVNEDNTVITDTVTTTNFLATMSRKYYGRMEFWVYIYLENKDKLQNPDHVPAGTVVVIPSRSKYGINPDSRESIEKAKSLTAEIYEPYR